MLSSKAIKEIDIVRNLEKKRQKDRFNIKHITGSGITLKNNEIKSINKIVKSLENRGLIKRNY